MGRLLSGDCEQMQGRLSEHLEGELWGWRRFRLVRHLTRCERCQAVLRSLVTVVEQLRALGREAVPSSGSAAAAVIGRIRREVPDDAT